VEEEGVPAGIPNVSLTSVIIANPASGDIFMVACQWFQCKLTALLYCTLYASCYSRYTPFLEQLVSLHPVRFHCAKCQLLFQCLIPHE
jgi:hypothetical protein